MNPSHPLHESRRALFAMWPGLFAVSMGLMAMLPTLPLYVEERFGIVDPKQLQLWTGIIFGAAPLAAGIVGPVWGALGDRVGRKPMALRAILAIAIVTGLMPFAPDPWSLTALRIIQGVFAGYVAPAMALVSAVTPEHQQGRTIARLQVALALGMLCGPPIGAEISQLLGRASVFWVCSAMSFVGALCVAVGAREDRGAFERRPAGVGIVGDLVHQSRELLRGNAVLVWLLSLVLLMRIGQNMGEPFIALFVRAVGPLEWVRAQVEDLEHALDRTTALAFVVLAVAQMVLTPVWGRMADKRGPLLCLGVLALGLGGVLWLLAGSATAASFLGWRTAAAVFMSGSMTLAYAAASKRVAPSRRSLAFSLVQSCIQLGLSLGPMVGGWLVPASESGAPEGLRVLFRIAAGLVVVAGAGMLLLRMRPSGKLDAPVLPIPEVRE